MSSSPPGGAFADMYKFGIYNEEPVKELHHLSVPGDYTAKCSSCETLLRGDEIHTVDGANNSGWIAFCFVCLSFAKSFNRLYREHVAYVRIQAKLRKVERKRLQEAVEKLRAKKKKAAAVASSSEESEEL